MSLESMIKRSYRSTGVNELDSIIYGWPRRGLALIYGSQKAGKTSLAMQAALQVAATEESHVLYLDTESGGASELRLYAMAAAMGFNEADIPRIVSMVHIYKANEISEQHRIITDDWDMFRKTNDVQLYVVDSIAWLYHQRVMNAPSEHVGSVAREVMGKLEMQTKTLLGYAAGPGASIIYTSWSASKAKKAFEEHQRREMARTAKKGVVDVRDIDIVLGTYGEDYIGGRFVGYMSKVIARIWRLQGDLRFFVVEAHREKPDGIGIYMRIGAAGLQPMPNSQPVRVEQEMIQRLVREEEAVVADTVGSGGSGQAAGRRMGRGKN
ncbi:MAG: AAA family ATPase [Candidatus Caldarchaeum sp.]